MGSKVEYVETSQLYATNYVRNSKAVGVLWAIFTLCFALIVSVAFLTPEWIGIGNKGRLGLWSSCEFDTNGVEVCSGKFTEFMEISNAAFKISTVLSVVCVALAYLTIAVLLLFLFMQATTVYMVAAWLQIIAALCMIASVVIYPLGWESAKAQEICGPSASQYNLGQCDIKWAYILAIIGCLDVIVLAILAFILATRHIKLQPEPLYGEINNAYGDNNSVAGSRKSLNLHPVMLMPQGVHEQDRFSEFSNRTTNSKSSRYARPENPSSLNKNFQFTIRPHSYSRLNL
uniref:Lipoma HMGIC fusion partner-like 3 protein n=2 Tax=Cacopsylla melanoneura TaxID=428564 RepID=A0A8D8XJS5_9HEMI